MTHFENRLPPEGINVSKTNPLVEFATLSAGILGLVALLSVCLYLSASYGAQWLPFSFEKSVADIWLDERQPPAVGGSHQRPSKAETIAADLQALADTLAEKMDVPEEISITIHYLDDDEVNAFATLGGNIYMLRGLLERLPHENALSMVLAHEIAHVVHRDPIRHLSGAIVVGLVVDGLTGGQTSLGSALISGAGDLVVLRYSRDAERDADIAALGALDRHYGHIGGAADLFEVFEDIADPTDHRTLALLRTHPLLEARIEAIEALAVEQNWTLDGSLTPLPKNLSGR